MNERLKLAREAAEKRKELGIKIVVMNPQERWETKKNSLRYSINAKCWDCQGAGYDPGTKERIRECEDDSCSLHEVRPYQKKQNVLICEEL